MRTYHTVIIINKIVIIIINLKCIVSHCIKKTKHQEKTEKTDLNVNSVLVSVPAVTKDIFVWIVGPRRSVNYFNCAV